MAKHSSSLAAAVQRLLATQLNNIDLTFRRSLGLGETNTPIWQQVMTLWLGADPRLIDPAVLTHVDLKIKEFNAWFDGGDNDVGYRIDAQGDVEVTIFSRTESGDNITLSTNVGQSAFSSMQIRAYRALVGNFSLNFRPYLRTVYTYNSTPTDAEYYPLTISVTNKYVSLSSAYAFDSVSKGDFRIVNNSVKFRPTGKNELQGIPECPPLRGFGEILSEYTIFPADPRAPTTVNCHLTSSPAQISAQMLGQIPMELPRVVNMRQHIANTKLTLPGGNADRN